MKAYISRTVLLGALAVLFVIAIAGKSAEQESAIPAKGFAGCIQPQSDDGPQWRGKS